MTLMKSRRRIAFPLGQDYADPAVQLPKQSRKSRATEWGPTVVLQRKRFVAAPGGSSYYDHFGTDGYQVGGGVEYTVTEGRVPAYVNLQYVYSQYNDHTSRQRVMAGVGIRFK